MSNLVDITDMDSAQLDQLLAEANRRHAYARARQLEEYMRHARAAERPLVWRPGELAILLDLEASSAELERAACQQRASFACGAERKPRQ